MLVLRVLEQIVCKHDCKLKRPNLFSKFLFGLRILLGSKGKRTSSTCSVTTECEFLRIEAAEFAQQILIAAARFFRFERANTPLQRFCVDRMRDSRVLAKVFEAVESSKKGSQDPAICGMA